MSSGGGPTPTPRYRPSRAVPSLVLALVGLGCCGLPGLVGAVLAHQELRDIGRGQVDPAAAPTARLARWLGLTGAGLWLLGVVGYVLLLVEVSAGW